MKSPLRQIMVALVAAAGLGAVEREPFEEYAKRRAALCEQHADGVILLKGASEEEGFAFRSGFRQEENFYYLTGWSEPGAALLLSPPRKQSEPCGEVLFLPERNAGRERFTGPRVGPGDGDLALKTGVAQARSIDHLSQAVNQYLDDGRKLYSLVSQHNSYGSPPAADPEPWLNEIAPGRQREDLRSSLNDLRLVKSKTEIELIQKAVDATVAAHLAAWRSIRPGQREYEALGPMMDVMIRRGALLPAYPPIIGAGLNSTVLHYAEMRGEIQRNDVVLMDVGAEFGHYAADITRTIPASGHFSERQRKIYDAVLATHEELLAKAAPGWVLSGSGSKSLGRLAADLLDEHGKRLVGEPLGQYFSHGIGHHVGLEVHDPGEAWKELAPGMVVTIEPGVYLPGEGIGIRIEDMIVLTEDGSRVMSAELPRAAAAIEAWMAREPVEAASGQ